MPCARPGRWTYISLPIFLRTHPAPRAEAVLAALLALRVSVSALTAVGYGEENPIADNDTPQEREANRRIEFRLLAGEEEAAPADGDDAEAAATVQENEAGTAE